MGRYRYDVVTDAEARNPRTTFATLGHLVCWPVSLGDPHCWTREGLAKALSEEDNPPVCLAVHRSEDGGFTCGGNWLVDPQAGVGVIYMTAAEVACEFDAPYITTGMMLEASDWLRSEVRDYTAYVLGKVFRFRVFDRETGSLVETCGGYTSYECAEEAGRLRCRALNAGLAVPHEGIPSE